MISQLSEGIEMIRIFEIILKTKGNAKNTLRNQDSNSLLNYLFYRKKYDKDVVMKQV